MKKYLIILGLILISAIQTFAQDDDDKGNERIRDKMREFIQKRLDLSKNEAERFTPVFLRYFKEWRTALRENRGDRLMLQKRVAEVRLQYRPQFKEIIGEQRSNEVYLQQEVFIQKVREMRQKEIPTAKPLRRNRSLLQ